MLHGVSNVFEKIMPDQISSYINSFLAPYLCGYRKEFRTQKSLLSLIWEGVGLGVIYSAPLRCWFSLNNSETVKVVTLAFCSIQLHFIRCSIR